MRQIIKDVFKYDELSDDAKSKARDWMRENTCTDSDWYDDVYSDADSVAKLIGIELDRKGKHTPSIYFSGFASQGDGACFEGRYSYAKGAYQAVKAYAPQDTELQRIAKELQAIQKRCFYRLSATTKQRGHYQHSGCMSVDVSYNGDDYRNIESVEDDVTQALRDFADWIYKRLNDEYDYQMSDEAIEEMIVANEYEFDIDGNTI